MWIPSFSLSDTRLSVAFRLWGTLASICIFGTILVANAYPLSWIALWPGAFSVVPIVVFLFYLSVLAFGIVMRLILLGWNRVRSRRHFEDALEGYTSTLNVRLDDLSIELDELRRIAEELDWKVKRFPGKVPSLRHVMFLPQSGAK